MLQRDWDEDWDCERVAHRRASLDVWGLIDTSVKRPDVSTGTSLSSSAEVPQTNLEKVEVDGHLWDFLYDGQAKVDRGNMGCVDGDIWSFLSRDMNTSSPPAGYMQLLSDGRAMGTEERAAFHSMAYWSHAKTNQGAGIFIVAPQDIVVRGEKLPVCMRRLTAYALSVLHEHVVKEDKRFVLVWVQFNSLGMWPLSAWKLKNSLHGMYAKNADAVHIVHPSLTSRFVELGLCVSSSPLLEKIAEKLYCHERVAFLARYFDLQALALPREAYEYDEVLDRQAEMARFQTELPLEREIGHYAWEYHRLPSSEI